MLTTYFKINLFNSNKSYIFVANDIQRRQKMKEPQVLYAIIDKENNKISINRYLNSEIPYLLGISLRKAQRIFAEKEKIETERYTIYKVTNIDMGNRGGKRYKKDKNDW